MNPERRNSNTSDDETSRIPEESSSNHQQNSELESHESRILIQQNNVPQTATTTLADLPSSSPPSSSSSPFHQSSSNSQTSDTETATTTTSTSSGLLLDTVAAIQNRNNSVEISSRNQSNHNLRENQYQQDQHHHQNLDHHNSGGGETDEMKRIAAKKLIERYFYQLLNGCGNSKCNNRYCASSGEVEKMTPNQAAARAIQLFSQDAKLCDPLPSKIARTNNLDCSSSSSSSGSGNSSSSMAATSTAATTTTATTDQNDESSNNISSNLPHTSSNSKPWDTTAATSSGLVRSNDGQLGSTQKNISGTIPSDSSQKLITCSSSSPSTTITNLQSNDYIAAAASSSSPIRYLDEEKILKLIECYEQNKSHLQIVRTIGEVFSSFDLLSQSFVRRPSATIDEMLKKAPKDLKSIKKEDLRTLEGDLDKDEDCSADKDDINESHHTTVDLPSLRRAMEKLFEYDFVYEPLNNSLHSLAIALSVDLRLAAQKEHIEKSIHIFVIVFEIMAMGSSEFLEVSLPNVCAAAARLPIWAQARLARIWAEHCKSNLRSLLQTLQQLVSLQVIAGSFLVHDDEIIVSTTKVLKVLYYANILAGQLESPKFREDDVLETSSTSDEDSFFNYSSNKQPKSPLLEDKLSTELGISVLDCRKPFLPYEEFYNEPLSDAIDMDHDYLYYKNLTYQIPRLEQKFSFMLYSFILTPATKIIGLYYDSRIRMYSERRTIIWTQSPGQSRNPYLKLKVRRDQIIDDALVELEMIAMVNPKDLKKQLVVEFVGEQGIDEGGVSKEFFQLIVEEIFNPDYGMFTYQEDTKTVWFNSTSFENEAQFTLIGIVLGLAIYNNIILAVNFPMVVYRKLMGIKGTFHDLAEWNPTIFRSLESMLEYDDNDMEDVFMQTFKINYKDVFGNTLEHELKPNGGQIFVNQENKHEFIELYSDFLLNTSIKKQFKAFRNGFHMVTDESPLQLLFRPEEIELLVCGSKKFDFIELEKSTEYEGGYTEKSQIIIDFWSIVHALPFESKRKLLEFTTGSDRVPVGGLSRLKLVIARNGPDSDRLPTSHTCFNVLLLPEYSNKEKLEDRLLKAINYSKGFGML